ncbi:MAG: hypothetical protein QNK25_05400 [Desulfobacterales bacterium]|nr:hypothetical protein [Desulfobacterales bacterium]
MRRKVHLIACGGTALTLMGIKESTKDVDFIVPNESEYKYLIKTIKDLGYKNTTGWGWSRKGDMFIFDLFAGKRIHTTELLESPLKPGNHTLFKEYSNIYIGILNYYDLIGSKLCRGTTVDFEDCLMLVRAQRDEIDIERIQAHSKEMASYDLLPDRVTGHLNSFLELLKEEKLYA